MRLEVMILENLKVKPLPTLEELLLGHGWNSHISNLT